MNRFRQILTIAFALAFSSWTFLCYLAHFNNYHRDLLSDVVYYRADRPFVQRTLLPTAVNLLTRLVPRSVREDAVRFVHENRAMQQIFTIDRNPYTAYGAMKLEKDYPVETAIALLLMFGCLLGFTWVILVLYDACYAGSPGFRAAVPAIAAAGVVPWLSYTSHPYDLVSLLLSATSLLLLKQAQWPAYLIVFALACLNKETAILNTLIFVTYFAAQGRLWTRFVAVWTGLQIAIYVAAQSLIVYAFRHNKGTPTEFHLLDYNLPILREWIRRHYGLEELVTAGILLIAICFRWPAKPLILRCGMIIAVPLFCLGIFLGILNEWRAFMDLYSPMLMLMLGSIGWLFGVRPLTASSEADMPEGLLQNTT